MKNSHDQTSWFLYIGLLFLLILFPMKNEDNFYVLSVRKIQKSTKTNFMRNKHLFEGFFPVLNMTI